MATSAALAKSCCTGVGATWAQASRIAAEIHFSDTSPTKFRPRTVMWVA
jgi:hypothetical protein